MIHSKQIEISILHQALHDAGEHFWVIIAAGPDGNHPGDLKLIEEARKRLPIKVCTVNNLYRYIRPDLIYSHDEWWWSKHYDEARQHGAVMVCSDYNTQKKPDVLRVQARNHSGISREPTYVTHGGNSGQQAINLLRNVGVRRMALLGFVMGKFGDLKRCHEPHKKNDFDPDYAGWRSNMARVAAALSVEGVRVTNCSRNTWLDCFKTSTMWAWLNRIERECADE